MTIYSPSELPGAAEGEAVEVGGRVLRRDGARLTVGDAFATIETSIVDDRIRERDLVVIAGTFRRGGVADARLLRIDYCPREIGLDAAAEGALKAPRAETLRFAELGVGQRLRARSAVFATVRGFFAERGYLEVETPCLVPSPGLDLHLDAFEVPGAGYLGTSPEYQMKRLLAGGLPRIFQLARCFRRGEAGRRHEREFTMLEWYRAYATVDALMDETEGLVREVLFRFAPPSMPLSGVCDVTAPFARMTVAEAFERFANVSGGEMLRLSLVDPDRYFEVLVDAVEPGLARLGVPVFLHRYPASQASLARSDPNDPTVAERFELYLGELELCNGFGELTDSLEQRGRLLNDQAERRAAEKPVYPLDERFLAALAEGMPPAAGNALGLDRLVALALGAASLEEVMAFPASTL
jgi:elongation factor P--(R)-beta-lysine ligase